MAPTDAPNTPIPAFGAAFAPSSEAQWRALVDKALKGAPFERLVSRTPEGLTIAPLSPGRTSEGPRALRASGETAPAGWWSNCARVDQPDVEGAHAQAREDIEGGANGLQIVFAGAIGAHGFGVAPDAPLARLLDGVDAGRVAIELDLSPAANGAAQALADLIIASGLDPASAQVCFGLDPLGAMALSGAATDWAGAARVFAADVQALAARGFKGPFCVADARVVHDAGGGEAQELAYALSCALAYWRALEAAGVALDAGRRMIGFRLAADADEFLTIAKLRALRRLWARVEEASGVAPAPIRIHAETAWRMMTRRDPWVNALRATVATFSAAVGGADRITVLPVTQALGLPDAFARRLARNTQLVLRDEGHLAKVADPVAGAGGFEDIGDALTLAAWDAFQAIEREGGLAASLACGALRTRIAAVRDKRDALIATRRMPLTGASEFPNLHEEPAHVLAPRPPRAAPTGPLALAPMRLAEPFEALRDSADAARAAGAEPRVHLVHLGPISATTARATFARAFFEAGGVEAHDGPSVSTPADAAAGWREFARDNPNALVCLCSSDEIYAAQAADAARALRAAGAAHIYLAGRPGALEADLAAAGVQSFVYAGADALAVLREAHKRLGLT